MQLIISNDPLNKSAAKLSKTSLCGFVELQKYCDQHKIKLNPLSTRNKSNRLTKKLSTMSQPYCYFWLEPSMPIAQYDPKLNWASTNP